MFLLNNIIDHIFKKLIFYFYLNMYFKPQGTFSSLLKEVIYLYNLTKLN